MKKREVYCMDGVEYLTSHPNQKAIITSLPDMEEVGMSLDGWRIWIKDTCEVLAKSLADDGVIFFYQTNRKYKGSLIDKSSMITRVFIDLGFRKITEKIILKQRVGTIGLFRPTYTKLFSFSKKLKSGKATPEMFGTGKMLYKNAMGYNAVKSCLDYVDKQVKTDVILDPFCGMGSVLRIANDYGYDAIGIDILQEQCDKAKTV